MSINLLNTTHSIYQPVLEKIEAPRKWTSSFIQEVITSVKWNQINHKVKEKKQLKGGILLGLLVFQKTNLIADFYLEPIYCLSDSLRGVWCNIFIPQIWRIFYKPFTILDTETIMIDKKPTWCLFSWGPVQDPDTSHIVTEVTE